MGESRMKSLSRIFVWWPGIDKDIEMLVSKCPQCQATRPLPPLAPLQPWSWPTRPWARLHIDYAGPVEGQMLQGVIDAHSKWRLEKMQLRRQPFSDCEQYLRGLEYQRQ